MKKINKGFTFIELLIAITIIAIMSTYFWTSLRIDSKDIVRQETERIAADVRQTRTLTVARIAEKTTGEFPPGGYGMHFYNDDPARYIVFADMNNLSGYDSSTDIKLKEVVLDSAITDLVELGGSRTDFYIKFSTANEISTNVNLGGADFYAVGVVAYDFRGNIRLAESTEDGFVWTNVGVSYDTIPPDEPSQGGGGGKGHIET